MTKLRCLHREQHQSPWLDNLTRGYLRDGTLARMVDEGIRGVTANPTTFAKAIQCSADYDEQFSSLMADPKSIDDAYWALVEVAPELAQETRARFRESFERVLAALDRKASLLIRG